MSEIIRMNDPRSAGIPVRDCREPLVDLRELSFLRVDTRLADPAGAYALLREGVAWRLARAARLLPEGLRLLVTEGYRPLVLQQRYFDAYEAELRASHPDWPEPYLRTRTSRSLSPPEIGPHVAGAAVDLTLCTASGTELDLGTPVNAGPEESDGACYTDAPGLAATARRNRRTLSAALSTAGLTNYPTEWWHWSYGDRYWALATGAAAARYGPADVYARHHRPPE
ncbi:M15 family metallopeptidase [Streptomyces sp. DSM 40750]|uniref:M15 family metallopeptidase n=1 Tax=Streptomyces sp. DSM 40750 TaxID=2801030 RepID=UPI00214A9822|nr:M15 family metallopeptidase [Streptomyces sp. DSM 40750]UUU19352.1 D-alanyl-D-alanine carboxypeptidase family protein [Streptomyces sp. DSM 40750]UUU27304.1 D-alanyl-D-alanine carboxypeptidase family protein [Streptomyces sp. DSM 40750]